MNVLLDSNMLVRMAQPGHASYRIALDAVTNIGLRGDVPCLFPQVLYEFWVVATRPGNVNGLGFTPSQASAELARLRSFFPLLTDPPALYSEWERIVTTHQVTGKNAHDARLVAALACHGMTRILTFNTQDFARYPGVAVVDPASVTPPVPGP